MKPARLFSRWKAAQRRLLKQLAALVQQARRRGSAEDIHELRVVARRVRLLTRLAAALYGRSLSHAYRDWARQLSALTDAVRDLDVALEWLEADPDRAALSHLLLAKRRRLWQTRRQRLRPLPAGLADALHATDTGRKPAARLARRCARLEQELRDRVTDTAGRFFQLDLEAQHDFRRVVRRWRYLRELQIADAAHPKDRPLQRLLRLQEALGDRQNLHLADGSLAALKEPPPEIARLRQDITAGLEKCEEDIRSRLKPFVKRPASA